jgi:hypothetical protein
MTPTWDKGGGLLQGPLLERVGSLPFTIRVVLGDVRRRFIPKGPAGRGYRAVARNGRVLLASPLPLAGLVDLEVRLRFQVWHRAILPGDPPEPYGVLLCVTAALTRDGRRNENGLYRAQFVKQLEESCELTLEVGGGLSLAFRRG